VLEPLVAESEANGTGVQGSNTRPMGLEGREDVPLSDFSRIKSQRRRRGGVAALGIAIVIIGPQAVDPQVARCVSCARSAFQVGESWIMTSAQHVTELRLPDLIQEKEIVISVTGFGEAIFIFLVETHRRRGSWETYLTTQIKVLIPAWWTREKGRDQRGEE
jgi:hypothetical protein